MNDFLPLRALCIIQMELGLLYCLIEIYGCAFPFHTNKCKHYLFNKVPKSEITHYIKIPYVFLITGEPKVECISLLVLALL